MKRIIEFGIYALVLILPWQTRWIIEAGKINGGASEYLTYSLYVSDILLMVLLVFSLIYSGKNIFTIANKFWKVLLLVFFFALFSLLVAENKLLALFIEGRILLAVGFCWLVFKYAQKTKLAFYFVISLLAPASLAIWQFLAQQTFASKWLGLAEHEASIGGTSVIETYANGLVSGRWLRAYGSFDHPNMLGGALAIGLIISLWLFVQWKKENRKITSVFFIYVSIIILSTGLFVSFSRSGWLALFLGVLVGAIVLISQKKSSDLRAWIFGASITLIVFGGLYFAYGDLIAVRTQNEVRLERLSVDQRKIYLEQAKVLIENNLVMGVGIGNYIVALKNAEDNRPTWEYQPVHNVFVLVFAEVGFFGIVLFIALLGFFFWRYGRKNYLSLALLVALFPALLFDHWLWSLHFGVFLFAVVIGLIISLSEKEKV